MLIDFDLDGVLVDSKPCMAASWAYTQKHLPVLKDIPFESYFAHIGRPFNEIMNLIGCPSDVEIDAEMYYFRASHDNQSLNQLYPHVVHLLTELRSDGHTLAIVTSKKYLTTIDLLERLGISVFNSVICPDSNHWLRGKPAPDPLWHSMMVTKHDIQDTLFVGDMNVDQECARRAGVKFIHAQWGYGKVEHPLVAKDPLDLLADIRRRASLRTYLGD